MLDDLLDACRRNDLERVRSLVTADPTLLLRQSPSGESPLLAALYARSGETACWLTGQSWPRTVFEAAAVDDVGRLTDLLVSDPKAADTYSADGWSPLHLAAFFGARRAAEFLLAHGADHRLLSRNHMANTPLHAALAAKHLPLTELLLEAGADPSTLAAGHTPLALAEGNGFSEGAAFIRQALAARGDV
ncbi:MAG: ankyrin repeat domain-containing protein [Gemmatimonadota bacterium]